MSSDPRTAAKAASKRLNAWLAEAAFPIWAERGFEPASGRFREKIAQDGTPLDLPSRGRVPPRQIYAFAMAPALGWRGDARSIVCSGLRTYLHDHQRSDGLVRPLGAARGQASESGTVELYDQAFALFGLAAADAWVDGGLERPASALRVALRRRLSHPGGGFLSSWPPRSTLESNPHMHLLEACLAWAPRSTDPAWRAMAREIVELAARRFIDRETGALREFFADDWRPAEGEPGRIVEPGHQFEWAWLLLRWSGETANPDMRAAALRLIALAEIHGVDVQRGVAIDSLLDDLSPHRTSARLWPQTERIKAAALAARVTGDPSYWIMAVRAVGGLEAYFDTPVRGLYRDRLLPDGTFVEEPAPASSLYHIVLAAVVLAEAVAS